MTYPGHTTTMLELIKRPRLLFTGAGRPKTIGDICGISAAAAATCLARMQNWWALAQAVLSAEFPEFDIAWCFAAFDIARVEGGVPANLRPVPRDELTRLADFLGLDPVGLVDEFRELRVVAERVRRTTFCSNASAWDVAIKETQACARRRVHYRVGNLLPALRRYVVYSGSSSGVEQCLSKCKFLMGELRNFKQPAKQRVLVLATSAQHAEKDAELCSSARLIWARNFGAPREKRRAALPERLQVLARRQKRKAEDLHGQASCRLRRRTALETVARGPGLPALADQAKGQAMQLYTAQHAKELQRQVGVRESRRLDAAADGTLGKGNTGLTDDAVRKHREARKKRNRNVWKRRASKVQTRSRPEVVAVDPGTTVFVETSAWEPELGTALRGHGCRRVDYRVLADIWVTRDPAKPYGKQICVLA